ncbi:MAG: PDZ domain-containing protein [Candidatus Acidiferrales bacterium]
MMALQRAIRSARRVARFLAALIALAFFFAAPAGAAIRYMVSLDHPERHLFHVEMEIPNPAPGTLLALPAWNALYQIRDFAIRLRDVEIVPPSDGSPTPLLRPVDKQTWKIENPSAPSPGPSPSQCTIRYSIEWDDPGPFDSQLNPHHAFINLAEILMYVPDRRAEDTSVTFENVPAGWNIAAELPAGRDPNSFSAPSYDALVDAPVEIGNFAQFEFDNASAHFRVVVDAQQTHWSQATLEDDLRRITAYELQLMEGPPFDTPRKEYTFIFHIGHYADVGGGGMEHANSTAISAQSVEAAAAIAAHEFFHVWNVKRIRPQSLEPVDYSREQYTRALWFAEGVTDTYTAYTLERTGLWPKEQFYRNLAEQVCELQSRPAHTWQSAEESSLDAWFEKYDAYNAPDRSISYYNKGQILGVLLDISIRAATENHKSLDDVLRRMNDDYARPRKPYDDSDAIRAAVEDVAGKSFQDFFAQYVSGVAEIPYAGFFSQAGLALNIRTNQSPGAGFFLGSGKNTATVFSVEPGSAAESAGLLPGDVILQANGKKAPRNMAAWLRGLSPGEALDLRVLRGSQTVDVSFSVDTRVDRDCSISELPHPADLARRIRDGILRGSTD